LVRPELIDAPPKALAERVTTGMIALREQSEKRLIRRRMRSRTFCEAHFKEDPRANRGRVLLSNFRTICTHLLEAAGTLRRAVPYEQSRNRAPICNDSKSQSSSRSSSPKLMTGFTFRNDARYPARVISASLTD
jgi:hypothetical protein